MAKIALVCNINNLMYPTARYLADKGHQVTLFLLDEFAHFLPENDNYGKEEKVKTISTGYKKELFHKLSEKELYNTFKGFDCYIGTEIAPAVLYKAGIILDIFFPAGTDLNEYPFREKSKGTPANWEIDLMDFATCQFLGLKYCRNIIYEGGDEFTYSALKEINYQGIIIPYCIPYVYLGAYDSDEKIRQSDYYEQFLSIRNKSDLMILCHSRQVWHDPENKHTKGSDILINGFKLFLDKQTSYRASLVLFEYGADVKRSKELIGKLGITDNVYWMPAMSRKHLMAGIRMSDVCAGNMSIPAFMYCSVCEIISQAKPVLQYGVDHENNVYPYLKSRTAEDVARNLQDYANRNEQTIRVGTDAQQWLKDNNIDKPVAAIDAVITDKNRETFFKNRWSHAAFRELWYLKHIQYPLNKLWLVLRFGLVSKLKSAVR